VLRPPDWAAWLDLSRSEAELLRPLEPGAIAVARADVTPP
jgi:putative SOS response-associated peptidase YedK